jgi:hypothetical protein
MNYEVKSAKEASLQEIFFDKNTNKLSYKDKYGIITIIGAGNITTNVVPVNNYSQFYNLLTTGQLVPGTWYSVPYQSVNFLNGWKLANQNAVGAYTSFQAREIYTGEQETLLVQAISTSEISKTSYSLNYPGDVIEYAPYTDKIGVNFDIYNGQPLPDSSTVSGFDIQWDGTNAYIQMPAGYPALFGHCFYLYAEFNDGVDDYWQDGVFEPLTPGIATCQYPYTSDDPDYGYPKKMTGIQVVDNGQKVLLLDLNQNDVTNYVSDSLYVQTVYAIGDAYGWINRRNDTERNINVPFDFRGRKYRRYKTEIFGSLNSINFTATGNTAADNIYHGIGASVPIGTAGVNATFTVVVSKGVVTSVTISNPGRFYDNTTQFTIYGNQIGGTSPADDIVITVGNISSEIRYCVTGTYFNQYGYPTQTTPNEYKDFKCFGEDGYETYNIEWSGMGGPDVEYYTGFSDNNVFQEEFYDNKLNDFTLGNTSVYGFIATALKQNVRDNILLGSYSNTIEADFGYNVFIGSHNNIKSAFYYNVITSQFDGNNIGYNCLANFFREAFTRNNVGNYLQGNIFGIGCTKNNIGNNFFNNKIENNFSYNSVGSDCTNNYLGANFSYNTIGNSFANNTIGEGFGFGGNVSQGNVIGNYFYNNNIGEYFYDNRIVDNFFFNTNIGNYFQLNNIKVSVSGTNFAAATHVYGDYNCEMIRRSDFILRLSYVDGTNTVQYALVNA